MTAQTQAQTAAPAPAPTASRFISAEVSKFARSHTRLYLALVLDVLHQHKGAAPTGYPAMVQQQAPHLSMIAKYCTVIRPACASAHAPTLAEFPATSEGLTKAVAWFENQAKLAGYTLSLEDTVRFFKGEWSVKAQAKAKANAEAHKQAETIASAVQATQAKQAAEEGSHKRSQAMQAKLEKELPPVLSLVTQPVQPNEGAELNDGWEVTVMAVHTKGKLMKITGHEAMDAERIKQTIEMLTAQLGIMVADQNAKKAA